MPTMDFHVEQDKAKKVGIIRCPKCKGTGAILNNAGGQQRLLSYPNRTESRCECCDGKGWIDIKNTRESSFCKI